MNNTTLSPTVASPALPEALLRLPLNRQTEAPVSNAALTDETLLQLGEQLEPIISALIARKAKQRRYTP